MKIVIFTLAFKIEEVQIRIFGIINLRPLYLNSYFQLFSLINSATM